MCDGLSVPLEERRRQHVALVKDEAHGLSLNPDPPHHASQVLVEVLQRVAVARLHLPRRFQITPADVQHPIIVRLRLNRRYA